MGMKFEEVKDISFETEVFFADTLDELNKQINDFLNIEKVVLSPYERERYKDLRVEEECRHWRGKGKIVPINISYDVEVQHKVSGPKNLFHSNKVRHQAILTYKYVECVYDHEGKIQSLLKTIDFLGRELAQEVLSKGSEKFTPEQLEEALRRYDAGERVSMDV